MNAHEQLLTARLQGFEAPGEIEAGERGRRLVLAAFAERAPRRRRRLRLPRIVWPVLAALLTRRGGRGPSQRICASTPRQDRAPFGRR